ncbi:unnamed protein product [marine sediment metagenome]|uniref:Uncharacterized protein n=1 Tax=marine sediment metagenome TaxID=412755 RepID=X1CK35_9ZZZZ
MTTLKYLDSRNRSSSSTYGLLSNEATAIMQREIIAPIGKFLVVGRKGLANLNIMYDWWIIYAIKNNLISNGKFIIPNNVLDTLLADEYIKFGAVAGKRYHIQDYLRMLGEHLGYNYQLQLSSDQIKYLSEQERNIRFHRKKYIK